MMTSFEVMIGGCILIYLAIVIVCYSWIFHSFCEGSEGFIQSVFWPIFLPIEIYNNFCSDGKEIIWHVDFFKWLFETKWWRVKK